MPYIYFHFVPFSQHRRPRECLWFPFDSHAKGVHGSTRIVLRHPFGTPHAAHLVPELYGRAGGALAVSSSWRADKRRLAGMGGCIHSRVDQKKPGRKDMGSIPTFEQHPCGGLPNRAPAWMPTTSKGSTKVHRDPNRPPTVSKRKGALW